LEDLGYPANYEQDLPLPFPTAGAVRFPQQAQFHPLKFIKGILPGLQIFENSPVRQLMPHYAMTDKGTVTAQNIIVATHFPILNKHGMYFLKMYQQRSYVLALDGAPEMKGMYLDGSGNGLSFRNYQGQLLLGGGGHRTGKPGSAWSVLEDFAKRHYPDAKITHRWAAQDCITLDGIPYIGRYSKGTQGLYAATGFNKWGMTSSMAAAQILTDLITRGASLYESVFSPSRSILRPQLALNALESTKNLLTPTAPRCPHLGCALKWNPQEHSWDCPCHGSRFEADGTLIDNPATGNLEKRD
jgi:glycine/D-amino acid oxidase-like deaminating enzyme